jgi:hypothetical protein
MELADTFAWLPVATGKISAGGYSPLSILELDFTDTDAVSLHKVCLLPCATAQNSGV